MAKCKTHARRATSGSLSKYQRIGLCWKVLHHSALPIRNLRLIQTFCSQKLVLPMQVWDQVATLNHHNKQERYQPPTMRWNKNLTLVTLTRESPIRMTGIKTPSSMVEISRRGRIVLLYDHLKILHIRINPNWTYTIHGSAPLNLTPNSMMNYNYSIKIHQGLEWLAQPLLAIWHKIWKTKDPLHSSLKILHLNKLK